MPLYGPDFDNYPDYKVSRLEPDAYRCTFRNKRDFTEAVTCTLVHAIVSEPKKVEEVVFDVDIDANLDPEQRVDILKLLAK